MATKPDKKLVELDAQITSISNVIDETEKRKAEAEARLAEAVTEIPRIMEDLKGAMVDGGDIVELDRRRKELTEQRDHAELLLNGLAEKLDELENKLSAAIESRNQRFRELVSAWLRKESQGYNKAVDSVRTHLQRFFGTYRLCSDLGLQGVFQEVLGGAVNYLGQSKLVNVGNGFSLSDLTIDAQNAARRPGPELIEALFQEVVG